MKSENTIDEKLYISSVNGDLEGVADALAQGGRVAMRYKGSTPLLAAADNGHTDICGLLLAVKTCQHCQKVKCLVCS